MKATIQQRQCAFFKIVNMKKSIREKLEDYLTKKKIRLNNLFASERMFSEQGNHIGAYDAKIRITETEIEISNLENLLR